MKGKTMLTAKQRECLVLIYDGQMRGLVPSYEQLAHAMNLKSKSGINRMILALAEKDMIVRIPSHARAITVSMKGKQYLAQGGTKPITMLDTKDFKLSIAKDIIRAFNAALETETMDVSYDDIELLTDIFNRCASKVYD